MKRTGDLHPAAVTVFFLCAAMIPMFCSHPAVTASSLALSFVFVTVRDPRGSLKTHLWILLLFSVMTLINPMISHKGSTVLFMLNDSPVTLESFLYGLNSAAALCSAVYWFYAYSKIMTTDKLLCVFGLISARAALVASCALRYIPLFRAQYKKTKTAQRSLGLYKDSNIIDLIRGNLRVFSIVMTWALENGIVTADSMAARGCGSGKRTSFTYERFTLSDALFTVLTLILFGVFMTASALDRLDIAFYPKIVLSESSLIGTLGTACCIILAAVPTVIELAVNIKWQYSMSKI